jgi:hypothetical protein
LIGRDLLRAQPQQRHGVGGETEWVRHHATIVEREGGHRLAVDEREQDRAAEARRVIECGEPADRGGIYIGGKAQNDTLGAVGYRGHGSIMSCESRLHIGRKEPE